MTVMETAIETENGLCGEKDIWPGTLTSQTSNTESFIRKRERVKRKRLLPE